MGNKYLEKIALLGAVSKALIRTKLGPAMGTMSKAQLANTSAIGRSVAGGRLGGKGSAQLLSSNEKERAGSKFVNYIQTKSGLATRPEESGRLMAVAARAKRMGAV